MSRRKRWFPKSVEPYGAVLIHVQPVGRGRHKGYMGVIYGWPYLVETMEAYRAFLRAPKTELARVGPFFDLEWIASAGAAHVARTWAEARGLRVVGVEVVEA